MSEETQRTETSAQAGTRLCPRCKMSVPAKASVCGHCRKQLRTSPAAKGCLVLLLLFVGVGIIGSLVSKSPPPSASTAPTSQPDGTISAGKVSVKWTERFPATTTSEAVNKQSSVDVPLFTDTNDCMQRFKVRSIRVIYESGGRAVIDLAPEIAVSIQKLFAGRGEEPALQITFKKARPKVLSLGLSEVIDTEQWPKKGYVIEGTLTLRELSQALEKPSDWQRVELLCKP